MSDVAGEHSGMTMALVGGCRSGALAATGQVPSAKLQAPGEFSAVS
jgi:hypothetical protein